MMKEKHERKSDKRKKNHAQEKAETEMDELNIHCMDYSVKELEFTMVRSNRLADRCFLSAFLFVC